MSEPLYLNGDSVALGDSFTSEREVECECGWIGEVETTEEYGMGEVTWYAEWKCPTCNERHTSEGWYDPREGD